MTPEEEIIKLKADLASEQVARKTAEDSLATANEAKDVAEALIAEQNVELEKEKSKQPSERVFAHKKKQYLLSVPKFGGIPGFVGKKFELEDLEENTVEVVYGKKPFKLVEYLIEIKSPVIKPKS